jgi:arsenite/tail-anchored protein-transporting ATPase
VRLHLPFVQKREIDLTKLGEELIIRMGNFKRNLILPRAFVPMDALKAELKEDYLTVYFGGEHE